MTKDEELELLRDYALKATKAIISLTSGGSEFFGKKIGDIYLADLPFCVERIRSSKESLIDMLKQEKRKNSNVSCVDQAERVS